MSTTGTATAAVARVRRTPRRRNQRMAGSMAMAASQASRIRNRKCCTTPTTQAAISQAETMTRILIVAAWISRWSSEIRIRRAGGGSAAGPGPAVDSTAGWSTAMGSEFAAGS